MTRIQSNVMPCSPVLGSSPRRQLACAAHEDEPNPRAAADQEIYGSDRRLGVEPGPQAAVPQHDLVLGVDRFREAPPGAAGARQCRRSRRQPERNDVHDRPERGIRVVSSRRDLPLGEHRTEPKVALRLACAHKVVAGAKRSDEAIGRELGEEPPHARNLARVSGIRS